jgi:hypothetical protein
MLMKISPKVIQYRVVTPPQDIPHSLTHDERVVQTSDKYVLYILLAKVANALRGLLIPSEVL